MATQDTSPSLIIGQQWSALSDFMPSATENDEGTACKDGNNKNSSDTSMRLGRQDMSLFGFCPSRDEFSLVVCEKCNLLIKPQALKQHIESRHGPTNLSSLGSISASALNSELGKKLLMPLPIKPALPPTTSIERHSSGTFKPLSSVRPPTKASLKQVPVSVKCASAPILGVGTKINITKPVKSGNRITPPKTAPPAISNPVVKMEKLEKLSGTPPPTPSSSSSCKQGSKQEESAPSPSQLSKNILSLDSKISTLMNGSIKPIISLTSSSLSAAATTTISSSVFSKPMSIAVTKTSTDTPLSSRNVTTFVNTASLTKHLMVAPIMTVGSTSSQAVRPVPSTKNTKVPRDHKDRKFLPCKDREYDSNKHCGVLVSETGKQCTRSLTCKTHALSLRRAVSGRVKLFDDLLREHKAAKEALLKAKAETQNAAAAANAAASANRVLVSPATINSALNALKQQMTSVMSQNDGKFGVPVNARGLMSSSVMHTSRTPFVKPHSVPNVFQRFSAAAVLPPAITVKEDKAGTQPESSSRLSLPSPEAFHIGAQDSNPDHNFFPHHPRPMASNQFGGHLNDKSCLLFSRKMDYVRAALLSALERQLNPPPHKKLCVESNLPKDSQALNSSQDPYEFNSVDTSGGGSSNRNPTLVNSTKSTITSKSKLPTPPVAASLANNQSSSLCSGNVASSLSISASPLSTLCATPIEVSCVSPSGLTLNWPIKSWDSTSSCSQSASPSHVLSSLQITNPSSRKRSGSSGNSNGQLVALTNSNGALSVSPAVSLSMPSVNTTIGTAQQTGLVGLITPTSLNSHQAGNLIAIPTVSLANTSFGQRSTSTLGTAKITSGTSPITSHKNNNIFKDFNLVLAGIDQSLINGQYVNISGAQLSELATGQSQTLFLNSFAPGRPNNSSTSGTTFGINIASSTSRPAKRSRSSVSKSHQTLVSSNAKISASALEGYKLIPTSSVITSGSLPPNAVLMDGGRLQDAMLTLAAGGSNPTLVAISSSTGNTNSAMLAGNPTQVLCSDSPSIVSSSTLINGLTQSGHDKSGSSGQRLHHSPSSRSHHHHHHHHSKTQHQQEIVLGSVLQTAPSVAVPISSGSPAAHLCSNQALFKPGNTLNLATKGLGGKLTMQPVSLTFPISVSQAGLASLTSDKPLQHQQQPQHTLLVTTGGANTADIDSASVLVAGKSELHLQSQMSSTSTSNLIS